MKVSEFKYKKTHRVRVKHEEKDFKRAKLRYGAYGLQAVTAGRLTERQLEAVKKTIKKHIKKEGNIWITVSLNRFLTAKPAEVRMGKGKGQMSFAITIVKAGTIFVEIGGDLLSSKKAYEALRLASQKLPLKVTICQYEI
jgi:large subunit ribosomal protein L16